RARPGSRRRAARAVGQVSFPFRGPACCSFPSLCWQYQTERRTLAQLTPHRDAAIQHLRESPADRQAETRASVRPGRGVIELAEVLEDFLLINQCNADSRVGDGQFQYPFARIRPGAD